MVILPSSDGPSVRQIADFALVMTIIKLNQQTDLDVPMLDFDVPVLIHLGSGGVHVRTARGGGSPRGGATR